MSIENANILEELKETLSCSICLDAYSQKITFGQLDGTLKLQTMRKMHV